MFKFTYVISIALVIINKILYFSFIVKTMTHRDVSLIYIYIYIIDVRLL